MKNLNDFYFNSLIKFEENDSADKFFNRIENNLQLGDLDCAVFLKLQRIAIKSDKFENYFKVFLDIQKLVKISNDLYFKVNDFKN